MSEVEEEHRPDEMYTGCVKWFNNKSGYGFIKFVGDGKFKDKDIFVHHSSLRVKDELYKYLVQGEYVQFAVHKMDNKDHENQAVNITGINKGDLMCETRYRNKDLAKSGDEFTQVRRTRRPTQNNKSHNTLTRD